MKLFSILIATNNRLEELKNTLQKIHYLFEKQDVECIICDDGSTDGTYEYIRINYPKIILLRNEKSKGLLFSRNLLLNKTTASYAVTLDDDAHIVSESSFQIIEKHFSSNPSCAVIAFRIFWGKELPISLITYQKPLIVKSFVGCGHVWNLKLWKEIPNYPEWFEFYGEEDFASFQLFKKKLEVHYLPDILVHHRVDIKARKINSDYRLRLMRSLRSGWYLYLLFYPLKYIPKRIGYTLWMQLKLKVFRGDFKALLAIFQALGYLLLNVERLNKNSNRLTEKEFLEYSKLANAKLYWMPEY